MGDGKTEKVAAQSQPGQQIPQKRHIQEGGQKVVPGVGILVSKPLADGVGDDVGVEPVSYTHLDVYKRQVAGHVAHRVQIDGEHDGPHPQPGGSRCV